MNIRYENVAVSTRIRLARNFADYPFPNRLKSERAAREIIRFVATELNNVDTFDLHYMSTISGEKAAFFKECYLISKDLIAHRPYSAVLISRPDDEEFGHALTYRLDEDVFVLVDEESLSSMLNGCVSVMINEEDHVREQYIMRNFDLVRGYERLSGIDDIISEALPFAFDEKLGYLTACPTNLGTGLRASVMLFLPALSAGGKMKGIAQELKQRGLTVRGAFGEGSGAEGNLFQVSNEVTLGVSEEGILSVVEENVNDIVEQELLEREKMREEGGVGLADRLLRSYGVLTNCLKIGAEEFTERMTDVKLALALGMLDGGMEDLDNLMIAMRPANIVASRGSLTEEDRDRFRARYAGEKLRGMDLLPEYRRKNLS